MSAKVGEVAGSDTPAPSAAAFTKSVLPAPRSPVNATKSPGCSAAPSLRPSLRVAAGGGSVSSAGEKRKQFFFFSLTGRRGEGGAKSRFARCRSRPAASRHLGSGQVAGEGVEEHRQ